MNCTRHRNSVCYECPYYRNRCRESCPYGVAEALRREYERQERLYSTQEDEHENGINKNQQA